MLLATIFLQIKSTPVKLTFSHPYLDSRLELFSGRSSFSVNVEDESMHFVLNEEPKIKMSSDSLEILEGSNQRTL